jgi:hypothetical protein
MNKNAIQKYAIWARNELIEQVKQRAYQYGIDEKGYGDENASVIAGRVLSTDEKRQRRLFVDEIKKSGYNQVIEEVAYTWFNRFIALRYMEVNDFLPTHIRVFSDANGNFNPEILTNVLHLDLPGLDKLKVSEYLNDKKTEELYRYLLLTQCNALNGALPEMFERLGSYTEMLFPNNILKQDSVLARLVKDINEEDWKGEVQIIGWMYQYYITELNEVVYDGTLSKSKIPKELISAATTLYTPDWAIRYMVDNSLGKLWLENHPDEKLKANLKYYLEDVEQTPEVAEKLRILRLELPVNSPEDIRLIDPCMGSGHILVYAFDVLMQIYEGEGYNPRDAAKLILEKNLYGLDIDRRAYQLAYFSLMMKARQYNRRILNGSVQPQVFSPSGYPEGLELGSIIKVDDLEPKPEMPKELTLFNFDYENKLNAWNFRRLLAQKYDVVVTNPPYLGSKRFSPKLYDYVVSNYPDVKSDLSMVMFQHALADLSRKNGFIAFITTTSWLFLSSFEKLRKFVLAGYDFESLVDFGTELFEGKVGHNPIAAWVNRNSRTHKAMKSVRLVDYCYSRRDEKEPEFFNERNHYRAVPDEFYKIQGSPIAYWVSDKILQAFENGKPLVSVADPKQGLATADNNRFLRLWYEVVFDRIGFSCVSIENSILSGKKWFPYNKGGEFRKWYGNNDYTVNWENDGNEIRNFGDGTGYIRSRAQNTQYYFRPAITWSKISSGNIAFRFKPEGHIFDVAGTSIFADPDLELYLLGFNNSVVALTIASVLSPTLNYEVGHIGSFPIIEQRTDEVISIVSQNIELSRADWDSFETSWDFKLHPLVELKEGAGYGTDMSKWNYRIKSAFENWEAICNDRFTQLKSNEEELNRIFIDIYGLQDELTPDVEDKDVTVRLADLSREIRSLISYAVGCMLGRYSLDSEGIAYAGGTWDSGKYKTFPADKDNILPICDDEYFDDDITGRFVDFVKTVYGADTLEENLKFIADALGGKGTPREVIRNYFLNDFFKDHVKIYQKRPIYWLFDSGKKNGFKALIYMHRYSRDLLAKLRTDYVHEQQERYRTQLSHIDGALNTASGADRAKLLKQQDKLTEQLREITDFEEKVHHLADQNIMIDLDNGVKKNYEIFADVLAKT